MKKFKLELTEEEMVILGVHTEFPFKICTKKEQLSKDFPNIPIVEIIGNIHKKIQKELVK